MNILETHSLITLYRMNLMRACLPSVKILNFLNKIERDFKKSNTAIAVNYKIY